MIRGINAVQVDSEILTGISGSLIPCYFGSAPYWQLDTTKYKDAAGGIFVIKSMSDAVKKIGYHQPADGIFTKPFSLCAAVAAHFGDPANQAGPIVVVVNDHELSAATTKTTANVALNNGKGTLDVSGLAILSSVTIATYMKGTDYSVSYDSTGTKLIFKDLKGNMGKTAAVEYYAIAGTDTLTFSASTFDVVDYFEQEIQVIPNTFLAPYWEEDALTGGGTVADKLISIAESQINSHWYTQACLQLDSATEVLAKTDKATDGYTSYKSRVCWPYYRDSLLSCVFPMSIAYTVAKQKVDYKNGNIPFESPSNEVILNASYLCDAAGNKIQIQESDANELNAVGIATANYVLSSWRTWGTCMANYSEDAEIEAGYKDDVSVQMRDYVCNDFQKMFFYDIDKPMTKRRVSEISGDYQERLDALKSSGAIIYGKISYNKDASDPTESAFVFDLAETSTPPGKSITARVRYTDAGMSTYSEEVS